MTPLRRMRRWALPSRTMARYVARMFIVRFVLFLLGLTLILQVLDLMGKSNDIMAAEGATYASLALYLKLRIPQLISQFTPFAALLGVVATLATLNQNAEVIIMKGVGLSAYNVIAPPTLIALIIALGHFLLNEAIVVKANARLSYWEAHDFAVDLPPPPTTADRSWMMDGSTVIEIESIMQNGRLLFLDNVSLYERDADANLKALVKARFATHTDGAWKLHNVQRFTMPDFKSTYSESEAWPIAIPAERFVALAIEPDKVSYVKLRQSIKDLEKEGYPTALLRAALYHKVAAPMASLLMPLLGAVAAFGLARGGQLFLRVIFGMALGFAFFVADNFMVAVGEFGAVPPVLSAWAPFLLFLLLGLSVLFYTEE
ncbi:MAG: LPS export ABC transporter permease LptG [Pseudomonadota bacterium]